MKIPVAVKKISLILTFLKGNFNGLTAIAATRGTRKQSYSRLKVKQGEFL